MHGRWNTQTALVTLLSALKLIQEILPRRHSTAQHSNHTHHNALAPSLQGKLVCPHDTSAGGQVTASTTSTCRRTRLAPSCTQRLVATQDVYNSSSPNHLLFWKAAQSQQVVGMGPAAQPATLDCRTDTSHQRYSQWGLCRHTTCQPYRNRTWRANPRPLLATVNTMTTAG